MGAERYIEFTAEGAQIVDEHLREMHSKHPLDGHPYLYLCDDTTESECFLKWLSTDPFVPEDAPQLPDVWILQLGYSFGGASSKFTAFVAHEISLLVPVEQIIRIGMDGWHGDESWEKPDTRARYGVPEGQPYSWAQWLRDYDPFKMAYPYELREYADNVPESAEEVAAFVERVKRLIYPVCPLDSEGVLDI